MDAILLVDHQPITPPAGPAGVVVRALVTISGTVPAHRQRTPLAISLVLDRSGSMDGDRLEAAKAASISAVERLHRDDVVSVIAFDDQVHVVAPPALRARQLQLVQQLSDIDSGGSTNLSGGWLRGRQHMEQALGMLGSLEGSSRRIVLLTDGHANAGITDPSTLVELARTARAMGITTTTIGVGEGYDDELLRSMADAGGGNSWYVERPDQAQDVLAEEMGNLLSVSAQGLSVTLTLEDPVAMFATHSSWPATAVANTITFDLGDLYASEPKPVLVELFVPADQLDALASGGAPIATLVVSADVLIEGGGVEHRAMTLGVAASLETQSTLVPAVEHAVLLARAARAREEAARRQREGDAGGAEDEMRMMVDSLSSSALAAHPDFADELQAQAQDLRGLAERYESRMFSEVEAKYQMQRSYNARRGKKQNDHVLRREP
ncbi:VWA domain-containing protein [Gemmatimonas sp.]|uniref:vWA domain-containing protein n=1 Tax=Gemmatimonas sp. TaxID=1962908 RepID=UPI00286D9AF5|nr:VWA domain-containing protein [Gemmatimonas sp.]